MSDTEQFLVHRRSRRSTAGNRMQAALAEFAVEETSRDMEDDNDFIVDKYEEDMFESDFESTDEELDALSQVNGEREIENEEREARKASRARVEKATAAAAARQKLTFNPQDVPLSQEKKLKLKRRVSLGAAVDAVTGQIIQDETIRLEEVKKRRSQRTQTIMMRDAYADKMKKSVEKKSVNPVKKLKSTLHFLTQAELISRALDNEEGNLVEHRDFLMLEEEKRKRARVIRTVVEGPLLRWISQKEDIKVEVPSLQRVPATNPSLHLGPGYNHGHSMTAAGVPSQNNTVTTSQMQPVPTSGTPSAPPPTPSVNPYLSYFTNPPLSSSSTQLQLHPIITPVEITVGVEKNYVVHEIGQYDGVAKASWNETMTAMFGNHAKWDEMKVYMGKGRPLACPKQVCPITGLHGKYLDPKTNVPYANIHAYKIIQKVSNHEFIWNKELCCYTADEGSTNLTLVDPSPESVEGSNRKSKEKPSTAKTSLAQRRSARLET